MDVGGQARDHFEGCRAQDVLRVVFADGTVRTGGYMTQAGMHFIHQTGPGFPLHGEVYGPIGSGEIEAVETLKTIDDLREERYERSRGERVPGREPVDRLDFRYRLETLARAVAKADTPARRREILRQFDDVADRIKLAGAKRRWMLEEGAWSLTSNRPPELSDLWFSDVASPSILRRPRDQDFDPDPALRRKLVPVPDEVADDPLSTPNVIAALREAGFEPAISLAGDPHWYRCVIQVDLTPGRLTRFNLDGAPVDGQMTWRLRWAGNDSRAGMQRYSRITKTEDYARLKRMVATLGQVSPGPPRPGI